MLRTEKVIEKNTQVLERIFRHLENDSEKARRASREQAEYSI
jgi:hypothetical protein